MSDNHRCPICECTVRSVARGGNGVLMLLGGRYVLVHAPCKRLQPNFTPDEPGRAGRTTDRLPIHTCRHASVRVAPDGSRSCWTCGKVLS